MPISYTPIKGHNVMSSTSTAAFTWDGSSITASITVLQCNGTTTTVTMTRSSTAGATWTGSDGLRTLYIGGFTYNDPTVAGSIGRYHAGRGIGDPDDMGSFVGAKS